MNKYITIGLLSLIGLVALFLALPQPDLPTATKASDDSEAMMIGPVRLFDGDQILEAQYVVIADGRIESVGATPPEGFISTVETNGMTLVPGLIDAHTHAWGNALQEALSFGVTTELDMFTDHRFAALQRTGNGATEGPMRADLFSAGTLITAPGGHGTEYGVSIPVLEGPEDAERFVADRVAEGSDYIKLVYHAAESERQSFPSISRESLVAVIDAAHQQKKLALVHISDHLSAEHAVEAGANGLVHTFFDRRVSESLIEQMVEQGVFIVPTLSVITSVINGSGADSLLDDPSLAERSTAAIRASLTSTFPDFDIPDSAIQTALDNTRLMHEAGIDVLAGTDAPNPGTAHGISLHRELALMVESGLSPLQALRSATRLPADLFGLSDRGRIAPGMIADLLLLNGRPDEDILATRQIAQVIKSGRILNGSPDDPAAATLTLSDSGLISDFSDATTGTEIGVGFVETTDQMMNGSSEVTVSWSDEDGGSLRVDGRVLKGAPYPWSGAYYQVAAPGGAMLDLSARTQLQFRVRGSRGSYTLMLFTNGVMMPFRTQFEVRADWSEVAISLATFSGAELTEVVGFAWVRTDLIDSFEMVLDDIRIQ